MINDQINELQLSFCRISMALKQSENFNRPHTRGGDVVLNRKAVVRMQSKSSKH